MKRERRGRAKKLKGRGERSEIRLRRAKEYEKSWRVRRINNLKNILHRIKTLIVQVQCSF